MAHVRVMFAEEEQAIAGRAPDSYVSLAANHKGKPGETSRRKAMGSKAAPAMTARLLIMISKPPEMTGRKAMGANVLSTMPARPPDTLHPTICKERKINMRKTLKKCLARLLALTVVASMTCSYVFAASFDDLQAAIDGSDKPEVSAPADSLPADKTPEPDPAPDGGSDDSSVPSEPSTPGESDQSGSTDGADSGDSSNTDNSGETAGTPTEGSETSDGTQGTEGGEVNNDNTTSEDGNGEGTEPTEPEDTEPPADTEPPVEPSETPADTESNEGNGENPAGGQPAEGDQTVKAPEEPVKTPEEPKKPENGSVVGNIDGNTQYGYGWTKGDDGKWTYSIVTWDKDSGEKDSNGETVYDRYVQLRDDVSYEGSGTSHIIIGSTSTGGKIILDLFGHTITDKVTNSKEDDFGVISVGDDKKGTGSLVLDDTSADKSGTITGGKTGVSVWGNSSFTMNGGTLSGNNGDGIGGGVVNRGEFTMNGGTISDNNVTSKGGGVFVTGTGNFTMNGGEIKGNTANNFGGGVYVAGNGNFTMNGGTISGNKTSLAEGDYAESGNPTGQGGGVYVDKDGTFTMNATKDEEGKIMKDENGNLIIPVISGNEAGEGGSVFIANGAVFTMNNGKIDQNTAHVGEGGGIYIRGQGTINAGKITNNKTFTTLDLGGGGIYIEVGGKLQLFNAIITDNKAGGLGAGLAACVHGQTVIFVKDGAAIYGNTASVDQNGDSTDTATSGGHKGNGSKIDGSDLWKDNQDFKDGAQDIFTASDKMEQASGGGKPGVIIGPQILGGGDAEWTGWMFAYNENGDLEYKDGQPVFTPVTKDENGNIVYADRLLGVTAKPDAETIEAARKAAAAVGGGVLISGNYSATHGGGIANNGLLVIGKDVIKEEPPEDVTGDKTLTKDENAPDTTPDRDLQDKEFTFVLKDKDGNVVTTGTNTVGGDVSLKFPTGYFYGKGPGTYTFTVTEQKKDNDPNTIYDETEYQVVVEITEKVVEKPDIGGLEENDKFVEYVTTVTIKKAVVNENGDTKWVELGEGETMSFNNKYTSTSTPTIPTDPGGDDDDDDDDEPDNPPPENPPEDPTVDVPEPEVPLANLPEEPEIEIPEEEVPLAESPQTGNGSHTALWAALSGFSLLGMLAMVLGKKRDEL